MSEFVLIPKYEKVIQDLLEQQYSIVDDFFSVVEVENLRDSLLKKYEEDEFKKAAIGNQFNEQIIKTIRGDFISWIDESQKNEAEAVFFDKIEHFTNYLNRTCFLGIQEREFHYALYPIGTFYKRHLDTFQNDDSRKLSIVCYLNEEDWNEDFGGELAIYKEKETINVFPLKGRMVVFESQILEHEVKPVRRERLSITGWLKTRKL
ncbi:2OG-Fe(II) oxygenase [Flavobacterium sp. NRK F7]|uniref:2OG-Fe(II) oxygenase n=1 Tax=Flavobacterium sp. NRK F7 TaxID=2954930 RepID=UPI0020907992|nr:2OG-Fe(II) oxygenase [Flavobacterium sp. NRK F7]MCO6161495.1 2OG-Fe(II) oxygenase [Flavobacterium sp. NRK F7]